MHKSIPLEMPVEFINITSISPLISKCQIKVCYVGEQPNRNHTIITKEVAKQLASSLPGSPIVGLFREDVKDFDQHNKVIKISSDGKNFTIADATRPYGFVDLGAKVWFQWFLDDDENQREYLVTEGYLWTGQYEECRRILSQGNNHSMEFDPDYCVGEWTKQNHLGESFFIVNEAIISKLCVLGEDIEPCFEGASITKPSINFSFNNEFNQQMFNMMNEIKTLLQEGGKQVEDILEVSEVAVSEETTETAPVSEEEVQETPAQENAEIAVDTYKKADDEDEDEKSEDADQSEESKKDEKTEDKEEKENSDDSDNKKKREYSLEEYDQVCRECATWQADYAALRADYNQLLRENESLREFKKVVERKEKQAMIDSFYMLSDIDKADVTTNIDSYSLDDIESKLSVICVRNRVNFDLDESKNNTVVATTYSVVDEMEDDSIPAWVKAVMQVEKTIM